MGMTGYLTDCAGGVWKLPPLLSWDVRHGLGEPCDAFEISFPYKKDMLNMLYGAVRFRGEYAGDTVFTGVVDEYEIAADRSGLTVSVRGRGLAALLMDNECESAQYSGAGLEYILRRHVYPWGVTQIRKKAMPAAASFAVNAGDSQWTVLKKYCRFAGGVTPRFSRDGVLLINGEKGESRAIDSRTAVSSSVLRDERYGVISQALVKNKSRGTSETVTNASYAKRGAKCRRVVSVPRKTGGDAMRYTAQYQIDESRRGKHVCEVTLPEVFAAFAGDTVALTDTVLGLYGSFTVYESRCWADQNGAGTVLTLEVV